MTSRKTDDMPHVECIVIDEDTLRRGRNEFKRVRTCRIKKRDNRFGTVFWQLTCYHEVEGAVEPRYCPRCGRKVVE